MANYFFGRIPDDKWKDFKTACAYFNISMRQVFGNAMDQYISEHRKAMSGLESNNLTVKKGGVNWWRK